MAQTRRIRLFALALLLQPAAAAGQGLVTPTSHWGGNTLPEVSARREWGLHFLGFTEYGKEVLPGTDQYTFTPYNDMDETLGFNIFTYSWSSVMNPRSVSENSVSARRTVMVGVVNDVVPRFLQNQVAHLGRQKGPNKLLPVPREPGDTPERVSAGKSDVWPPFFGYSEERFVQLHSTRRRLADNGTVYEERVPTPVFVGGGYALGTLNQEMFLHAGSNVVSFEFPDNARPALPCLTRCPDAVPSWIADFIQLRSVGAGATARGGVLLPGIVFDDLTAGYANLQGVVRFDFALFRGEFPVQLDVALTQAHGFFVRTRTEEQRRQIAEVEHPTERVYGAKSPASEFFVSGRVRLGHLTFEYVNDQIGGKDKGPSFGVNMTYAMRPRQPRESTPGAGGAR